MASISGDLSTGLVSVWEMESGALTTDSHGSNTLTNNNTVGEGTGVQGGCGDFESSSSTHLSISDASQSGLDSLTNFSVSLWYKAESIPANATLAAKWGTGATTYSFLMRADASPSRLLTYVFDGSSNNTEHIHSFTWATATWYHVVMTFNGTTKETNTYINNANDSTIGNATGMRNTSPDFTIGAVYNTGTPAWYADGLIDQVAFWNIELSAANVSTLYNSGDGIPYEAAAPTNAVKSINGVSNV